MTIDIRNITCFGFYPHKSTSYITYLKRAQVKGYNSLSDNEKDTIENQLAESIEKAYDRLVTISFVDLDTDFKYECYFDNIKKRWKLELPGSSDDAIADEDLANFVKDPFFKKICMRSDEYLSEAYKLCNSIVIPNVVAGKFLKVNEIKLEAICDMLRDPSLRRNLKFAKM